MCLILGDAYIGLFCDTAVEIVVNHDAFVGKFVGDEVIGIFVPSMAGSKHAGRAVAAATALLRATGHVDTGGPWVRVDAGFVAGIALANRRVIGTFAARPVVPRTADPGRLPPQRLPRQLRCRCATPVRFRAQEEHVLDGMRNAHFWATTAETPHPRPLCDP